MTSHNFIAGEIIPEEYTCRGDGLRPALFLEEVPSDTKSIAIIMDDPDAPSGTFVHWVLYNVPFITTEALEDSIEIGDQLPAGSLEGKNGRGEYGWTPPCPLSGLHHYHFKAYALSIMLPLGLGADKLEVLKQMEGHILSEAEIVGIYGTV